MRCILFGHTPILKDGAGEYAGQKFIACAECGNTLSEERADMHDAQKHIRSRFDEDIRRL